MKQLIIIVILLCGIACGKSTPEQTVHRILSDRQLTLVTAESCTGGVLAARFTALPGASVYFKGGVVAYNLETKRRLLEVDCATIGLHGVVSEEVARQMAEGARRVLGADYAVATTGIAGPSGGTPETPVGTVWIAVAGPTHTVSERFFGGKTRHDVITQASTAAIKLLQNELQQE